MPNDPVEVLCEILRQTEKAYLVDHGGDEGVSHREDPDDPNGNLRVFVIPEWLAIEKDMV